MPTLNLTDLQALLDSTDWSAVDPATDLPRIVSALHALEAADGVTELHRAFSKAVLPAVDARLVHSRVHRNSFSSVALSPCGRYIATGSESPSGRYEMGGEIAIWELESGRVLGAIYGIEFGVGWSGTSNCLQWSADGSLLAAAFSTNVVGTFAPFDHRGGPLMLAGITNGWDSPPAFALSPDATQICISCWGPDDSLPGAVIPTEEGGHFWDDDEGIRWFAECPEDEDISPLRRMAWSEDGHIYGNAGGEVWAVDDTSLELRYATIVHDPARFSPDGKWIAHNPAGLAIYDGLRGTATTKLPMIVGGTELVWSPVAEQRRVALVVGPGNAYSAEPGVHIFDDGELVATVHDEPTRDNSSWDFGDVSQFAFSPDGESCALITAPDKVAIWSLLDGGSHLRTLDKTPGSSGLLWGTTGLAAIGQDQIEFLDPETGAQRSLHRMVPPPGLIDPVPDDSSWLHNLPGDRGYFPVATEQGWRWVLANPDGLLVCEPSLVDHLDDALVFSLAGGRLGWPWRWAQGTDVVTVATTPDEIDDVNLHAVWKEYVQGAAELDSSNAFETLVMEDYKDDFCMKDIVATTDLVTVQNPTRPVSEHFAPEPLSGAAITAEALRPLIGKPVLFTESWRPRFPNLVVIVEVEDNSFRYFYRRDSGSGSGGQSFDGLEWIGAAQWSGPT